ncbi:BrnT family toxin [Nostoc sp. CHAB 5784]|uniref:BrnT family toxin n=1 Tax=Nostoc mirabile TaxID=2907820 RepID=UPI001E3DE49F|nr:BrnT family toxin [Nostoc mirabile]MCC5665852.1 BrnT family toxin [Nostoc mirabile CHAB5784]
MEFEWDKNKNQQNIQKHGISFEEATEIFDGVVFTSIDERYDYEEIREISIGSIQGVVVITVAHTDRNGKIRLISARKATPKERRTYYEYLAQST